LGGGRTGSRLTCRRVDKCRNAVTATSQGGEVFHDLKRLPVGKSRAWWRLGSKPMMKIQTKELGDKVILQIEGRVSGAFVGELENCWQAARASQPGRQVLIDLTDVTCVDRSGRSLLERMCSDGVGFQGAGLAMQDILDQIMEHRACG